MLAAENQGRTLCSLRGADVHFYSRGGAGRRGSPEDDPLVPPSA